jgi:hypothetical protein
MSCIYENLPVYSELCSDTVGPLFDSVGNVAYSEILPSAGQFWRSRRHRARAELYEEPMYEKLRISLLTKLRVWLASLLKAKGRH